MALSINPEDPQCLALLLPEPAARRQPELTLEWNFDFKPPNSNTVGRAWSMSPPFAAYWYPRIGVYDDISGWDR